MSQEKTFNIPIRKEFRKAPKYKRAKKAVSAVREFLKKHMKTEDIRIGSSINLKIWERGIKNPPHHVKVVAVKDDKGAAKAELFGTKIIYDKKNAKKEAVKKELPKLEKDTEVSIDKKVEESQKEEIKKSDIKK